MLFTIRIQNQIISTNTATQRVITHSRVEVGAEEVTTVMVGADIVADMTTTEEATKEEIMGAEEDMGTRIYK